MEAEPRLELGECLVIQADEVPHNAQHARGVSLVKSLPEVGRNVAQRRIRVLLVRLAARRAEREATALQGDWEVLAFPPSSTPSRLLCLFDFYHQARHQGCTACLISTNKDAINTALPVYIYNIPSATRTSAWRKASMAVA